MLNAVLFWTLTKALTPGGNSFKWSFSSHTQVTTKAILNLSKGTCTWVFKCTCKEPRS